MRCARHSSRETGRLACAPHFILMTRSHSFLVARGLARAMLAGSPLADGVRARCQQTLGDVRPPWLDRLVEELLPLSSATWEKLSLDELAQRITESQAFHEAFTPGPPRIVRWILRPSHMHAAPLGLHDIPLPQLDDAQTMATWLRITPDDLRWFCDGGARRRKNSLAQQHYNYHLRPKASGGRRLIEAPRSRLKQLQEGILRDLLSRVPVHEACHGFVGGRSVITHARLHEGQAVVIRFDLRDFFASVQAAQVQAVFETLGYPPGVAADLTALCTTRTPEPVLQRLREDDSLDWHQAMRLRSAHLPQGAPSSPMLANLCAFRMDLRLAELAHVMETRYSRYADDLVFSGGDSLRQAFTRLQAWVGKVAAEEGREINHRKTRLMTQAQAQTVCGVVVNAHANLRRAEFDRLRAILHRSALDGPAATADRPLPEWRRHLLGRIAWAEQLNPAKSQRLRALWDRIAWPADAGATIAP